MKKIIFLMISVLLFAYQKEIFKFDNYISKISFNNKYLIVGFENGSIKIKNFNNKKTSVINLPKIKDFMDNKIPMPIYSLDIRKNKILILAEDEDSKRTLFIYNLKTKKLNKIWTINKPFMKANFLDDNNIFFGLLSDEIALYNLKTNKFIYQKQIGNYVFSTFKLNKEKNIAVIGDESGILKVVDTKTGKKLKEINKINKGKTLSVDIYNGYILNASDDQKVGIYDMNNNLITSVEAKFLPYAGLLLKNKFIIQYNENNDLALFDLNGKKLAILKGHTMPLNGIYRFKNKIISFSPAEIIIFKGIK